MVRGLIGLAFAMVAALAIFVHHQLMFGLGCILAGACVMSWPTR